MSNAGRRMTYCSSCGSRVSLRVPDGDNRERYVCDACGVIHYQNPRVVTGTLPVWNDGVLLCRRAIEPRKGRWTLPAGFLEMGETASDGAARETREEANAEVEIEGLYTVFNLPHISQIYLFFRARLIDGAFSAGNETLEARLFDHSEVPWDDLAFPVITNTLRHYFADRARGQYPVRTEDIVIRR